MNSSPAAAEASATAPNGAMSAQMKSLIADIEEVLARAAHFSDQDVTTLRDSLRQRLTQLKSGLSENGRRLSEATRTAASATDGYVHRSPWQAIGIAAATGAAMGYLLARR